MPYEMQLHNGSMHRIGRRSTQSMRCAIGHAGKAYGPIEEAVLDVVCLAGADRLFVDVTVTGPRSSDPERAMRRAQRNGAATAEAKNVKRLWCPHPAVTPVAIDTMGRVGGRGARLRAELGHQRPRQEAC